MIRLFQQHLVSCTCIRCFFQFRIVLHYKEIFFLCESGCRSSLRAEHIVMSSLSDSFVGLKLIDLFLCEVHDYAIAGVFFLLNASARSWIPSSSPTIFSSLVIFCPIKGSSERSTLWRHLTTSSISSNV